MIRRSVLSAWLVWASLFLTVTAHASAAEGPVRVQGMTAVSKVMRAAAPELAKAGIEIKVGDDCTNTQAISALGTGEVEVALLARPMTAEERAAFPGKKFHEYELGSQAVAIMVSRPIWESGVRALKREQVEQLYEGRIDSWKQLGGEDRSFKFYEPLHDQGVWEVFATWLYGDLRKAPAVPWEMLKSGADVQTTVEFQSSASSVAALRWADRKDVFPLAIIDDTGAVIEPTVANIANGTYPLARPVYAVFGDEPVASKRKVLEFLESDAGQKIIASQDLIPASVLKAQGTPAR